jgi:uncharacterized membrane protein YebE (DUF533 family)
MPSGRRLDDGSIVRVLWVYGNKSRARWGDATMVSKAAAGVVLANQALQNSNAGFQLEAAAILPVNYDDTDHMKCLAVSNYNIMLLFSAIVAAGTISYRVSKHRL